MNITSNNTLQQRARSNKSATPKAFAWVWAILLIAICVMGYAVFQIMPSDSITQPGESTGDTGVKDTRKLIPSNATDHDVAALLLTAIQGGNDEFAITCIDWLHKNDRRATPDDRFHTGPAVIHHRLLVIKHLLDEGVRINVRNLEGDQPLHLAARDDSPDMIKLLIEQAHVSVNVQNQTTGNTPLHVAAKFNSLAAARTLTQLKANINATNYGSATPLHLASKQGYNEMVQLLMESGADPEMQYKQKNAAQWAQEQQFQETAKLIRQHAPTHETPAP